MLKRIGIITMYHNSQNYGGVLQAYALQKAIENLGYNSEQISFLKDNQDCLSNRIRSRLGSESKLKLIDWILNRCWRKLISKLAGFIFGRKMDGCLQIRKNKFQSFREEIPHSDEFTSSTITNCVDRYAAFICGSDQIWKPGVLCSEFMLDFVPKEKVKMSYAASISRSNLSQVDIERLVCGINQLNAVSLREKQDVELLQKYTNKEISWVLDPTLLLDRKEWEKLSVCVPIEGPYLFCYLLGNDSTQRRIILKTARMMHMKIVSIPFADGKYNFVDLKFGDIKIGDAGPLEFLSLIKNAHIVITDSFHATVFSSIFDRDFYVLERAEEPTMNTRILSLLEILEVSERFVKTNELADKIINGIQTAPSSGRKLSQMRSLSMAYLKKGLSQEIACI